MQKLKKRFDSLTLYKKFLVIIIGSIICICMIFLLALRFLIKNYEKTLYQANAALLSHVSSSIDSEMESVETISYNILTDNRIQQQLVLLDKTKDITKIAVQKRDLYNILNSYTFYNGYVESIVLVFQDQSFICVGNSSDLEHFSLDQIESRLSHSAGKAVWMPEKNPGNLVACTRQIRQIKYLTLKDLALYIVVDLERMIQDALISAGYSWKNANFILMEGEKRIYPAKPYHDELCVGLIAGPESKENSYQILSLDGARKFVIDGQIPRAGWKYLYFRNYDVLFNQIQVTKAAIFFLTILCCSAVLLAIRIAIRRILQHIEFLIQKIRCFGKGEKIPENPCCYQDRTDEIGQLHQNFDEMTKSVKILRDENYDKQILLKDTTIKMLQQQINPHFLYNTLDTINWLALEYGVDDISTMVSSLGMLFRSAISNSQDLIPLTEELDILNNYINIQQIRFKNMVTFELSAPEDLGDIRVPKLCIQPLVENALKYSTEYTDTPCVIQVMVKELKREYLIKVSNTGSQFEEDLLKKFRNRQVVPSGSRIGLSNIDSRLKLLYGSNYGLHLCNKNKMATVVLLIPKK